ncbi:hypothetical protein SAMN05444673_4139 [Bacillus sp. OV166]|nr:hypothetical protein SAMN05444673_4139 [Bacillus sp. OV166]
MINLFCETFHKMFNNTTSMEMIFHVYYHYSHVVYITRGITNEKDISDTINTRDCYDTFFAQAHVKWFTKVVPHKESIEHILSPMFIFLTLVAAIVLAALTLIIPKMAEWGNGGSSLQF